MKRFTISLMTLLIAITVACTESKQKMDQAGEEVKEATKSVENELQVTKEEFVSSVEAELNTIDNQIGEIQTKIDAETGEMKTKMQNQLDNLTQMEQELKSELEQVKASTDESWQDMRTGINDKLDSIKKTFDGLKSDLGFE